MAKNREQRITFRLSDKESMTLSALINGQQRDISKVLRKLMHDSKLFNKMYKQLFPKRKKENIDGNI